MKALLVSSTLLVVFFLTPSFGQDYSIADTAQARKAIERSKLLLKENKLDSALQQAELAQAIYKIALGAETEEVSDAINQKAWVAYRKGDAMGALSAWEETLEIRIKVLGEEHKKTADTYHKMGGAYFVLGNSMKALELTQKALLIRQKVLDAEDIELADSYAGVGYNLMTIFKSEQSIELFNKALHIYKNKLGPEDLNVATTLNNLGIAYQNLNKLNEAEQFFLQALQIREILLPANHPEIGDSYRQLSSVNILKGAPEKAIEYSEQSLPIILKTYGDSHIKLADAYMVLGNARQALGESSTAIELYQKALEITQNLKKPNYLMIANLNWLLGKGYYGNSAYDTGITYVQKAKEIYAQIYGPNAPVMGFCHLSLGELYYSIGDLSSSEKELFQALDIYTVSEGAIGPGVSKVYVRLVWLETMKGNLLKALDYGKEALAINTKLNLLNTPSTALIYNNLSITYYKMGDYDRTLELVHKALDIYFKTIGQEHEDVVRFYVNIGNVYSSLYDHKKAVEYYSKALDLSIKRFGPNNPNTINISSNLGHSHSYLGQHEQAIAYQKKVLELRLETFHPKHREVAASYQSLGFTYASLQNFEEAINYYKKAYQLNSEINGKEHFSLALSANGLGVNYTHLGQIDSARHYFEIALSSLNYDGPNTLNKVDARSSLIIYLAQKATASRNWYLMAKEIAYVYNSEQYFRETIQALEFNLGTLSKASRAKYNASAYAIYEGALLTNQVLLELTDSIHYKYEAFDFSEKTKAINLLSSIQESEALSFAGIPDTLLQLEDSIRIQITLAEKKRQELINKGINTADSIIVEINAQLFDLNTAYINLKTKFEEEFPEYFNLVYNQKTVRVKEVQKDLLKKDQSLLEYFVGDSSLFIFVVNQNDYELIELERDSMLEKWVNQMRKGITARYTSTDSLDAAYRSPNYSAQQYTEAASALYDLLVAPIKSKLNTKVIIVPDAALGYIPFQALLEEKPQKVYSYHTHKYFGLQHQISYSYSATLLKEMQEKQHRNKASKSLLAVAPYYDGSQYRLDSLYQEEIAQIGISDEIKTRGAFDSLPYSGIEAYTASQLWKGDFLKDTMATEQNFAQLAKDYRILHLSTHGEANDNVGEYAYLAFTEIEDDIENELLYIKDIYNLQLNADLVVLSACQTGTGTLQRGEGVISLARAFAYAGAKSIVTTLWKVDDQRTKDLMIDFHKFLLEGEDKDTALWKAQKAYLENPQNRGQAANPFFWAPFIGIGDMGKVEGVN